MIISSVYDTIILESGEYILCNVDMYGYEILYLFTYNLPIQKMVNSARARLRLMKT